jgi:hypothetical protein
LGWRQANPLIPLNLVSDQALTTQDVEVGGYYLVTAFSGTWGGVNIQGLLAPGAFGGNDNKINPSNVIPFDYNGLSFAVVNPVQGFTNWNLFKSSDPYTETYTNNFDYVDGNFSLKLANAVPEPATWAMMIGGLALVGVSMRRRKAAISFA